MKQRSAERGADPVLPLVPGERLSRQTRRQRWGSSYALSAVGRSRLDGELGPYPYLWIREDHSGPAEKISMRSPSGSKTKNA